MDHRGKQYQCEDMRDLAHTLNSRPVFSHQQHSNNWSSSMSRVHANQQSRPQTIHSNTTTAMMRATPNHAISVPSHEIFVGNLSYFCEERDLFALFDEYGHVKNVRIVWNDERTRPLMYGFVLLASHQEVIEMKKLLDNHLFMGRHLRIEACGRKYASSSKKSSNSNQHGITAGTKVHIAMLSSFPVGQILTPTESRLRRYFIQFGTIIDVQVNFYATMTFSESRQEGFGFITFEDCGVAETVLTIGTHNVDGIEVMCSFSTERGGGKQSHDTINQKGKAVTGQMQNHLIRRPDMTQESPYDLHVAPTTFRDSPSVFDQWFRNHHT